MDIDIIKNDPPNQDCDPVLAAKIAHIERLYSADQILSSIGYEPVGNDHNFLSGYYTNGRKLIYADLAHNWLYGDNMTENVFLTPGRFLAEEIRSHRVLPWTRTDTSIAQSVGMHENLHLLGKNQRLLGNEREVMEGVLSLSEFIVHNPKAESPFYSNAITNDEIVLAGDGSFQMEHPDGSKIVSHGALNLIGVLKDHLPEEYKMLEDTPSIAARIFEDIRDGKVKPECLTNIRSFDFAVEWLNTYGSKTQIELPSGDHVSISLNPSDPFRARTDKFGDVRIDKRLEATQAMDKLINDLIKRQNSINQEIHAALSR